MKKPDTLRQELARVRQNRVIKRVVGSGGKMTLTEAARQEGYSDSYALSGKLQKTKVFKELKKEWNELLEERFPDARVVDHIDLLLEAKDIGHYIFPKSESDESIRFTIESYGLPVMQIKQQGSWKRAYFSVINAKAKKDALEMILNLKQKYDNTFTANINITTLTDEELDKLADDLDGAIAREVVASAKGSRGKKEESGE